MLRRIEVFRLPLKFCRQYGESGGRGRGSSSGRGRGRGRGRGSRNSSDSTKQGGSTFTVADELTKMSAIGVKREKLLVGGLRDSSTSEFLVSKHEKKRMFEEGTLSTAADPDGIYKPSQRPKRLVMPIDFNDVHSNHRRRPSKGDHEIFNEQYIRNAARPQPNIPTGDDLGGRARRVIEDARRPGHAASGYNGSPDGGQFNEHKSVPSGFATTSASYTSGGSANEDLNINFDHNKAPVVPKGALAAAEVPEERTVADCFRFLLDNCKNLGVLGEDVVQPRCRSLTSCKLPSNVSKLTEGGCAVYDPVVLPLSYLTQTVSAFCGALEAGSESSVSENNKGYVQKKSGIYGAGTSPARSHILPPNSTAKRVGRTEALRLLAQRKKGDVEVSKEKVADSSLEADMVPSSGDAVTSADFEKMLINLEREQRIYRAWDIIEATPLNSPNNGASAQRGRSFATHYVTQALIHTIFPNCRSRLTQSLLHKYLLGPLAVINAANELGLTSFTNYETEVGLYRESIIAYSTYTHARRTLLAMHRDRYQRKNIETNDFQRVERTVRSLEIRLGAFPVDPDTLHLRYKWLEDLFFSFIDFVRLGEGDAAASRLIDHYLTPTLARHKYRKAAIEDAMLALDRAGVAIEAAAKHSSSVEGKLAERGTLSEHLEGAADVLHLLRDCLVDVLLIGDGQDTHGNISASDGIHVMQLLVKRHVGLCNRLCAQLRVAEEGRGSGKDEPPSIYPLLNASLEDLRRLMSSNPRLGTVAWQEENVTNNAGTSVPTMATRGLDAILKYHPLREAAHNEALLRSSGSGPSAIQPYNVDAGGSGLLLDAQGSDEEVAAVAFQLHIDGMKGQRVLGSTNTLQQQHEQSHSPFADQIKAMRSFMTTSFLPPSTLLATANSSITKPLQELQIILKYCPHVFIEDSESANAALNAGEPLAPGARSYSLYFDVHKGTSSFEHGAISVNSSGGKPKAYRQQQYFVATLYLYHYAPAPPKTNSDSTTDTESDDTRDGATAPLRVVKKHVLGTGIGINIDSATHAAAMRVLKRYYYKASLQKDLSSVEK